MSSTEPEQHDQTQDETDFDPNHYDVIYIGHDEDDD